MNNLRKIGSRAGLLIVGLVGAIMALASPAYAAPAPPSAEDVAESALASFGDALFDTFLALVSNPWVIAVFAVGFAIALVRRVLRKGESKLAKPVS